MTIKIIGVITYGQWLRNDTYQTRLNLWYTELYYAIISTLTLDFPRFCFNVYLAKVCYDFARYLDPKANSTVFMLNFQRKDDIELNLYAKQNLYGSFKKKPGQHFKVANRKFDQLA